MAKEFAETPQLLKSCCQYMNKKQHSLSSVMIKQPEGLYELILREKLSVFQ